MTLVMLNARRTRSFRAPLGQSLKCSNTEYFESRRRQYVFVKSSRRVADNDSQLAE